MINSSLPPWCPSLYPSQSQVIDYFVDQFSKGVRVGLLDAPTGFGKTLTAEMIRRELGCRGLYVCTSKPLQDQFVHDFPAAAILKGRSNYPTLDYPDDYDDPWTPISCADCDKHEGHCSFCSDVHSCPYELAKHTALKSTLCCTNTSYFLTESNGPGRFSNKFPLVIIDEADKLESQLLDIVQVQVTGKLINDLGLDHPQYKTKPESWAEWCVDIAPTVFSYAQRFRTDDPKQAKKRTRFLRLAKRLEQVGTEVGDGGWTYDMWPSSGTVTFKPIRVTKWADSLLWRHSTRFLLMSGTLIPDEMRASLAPPEPTVAYEAPSNFPITSRPIRIVGATPVNKNSLPVALPKIVAATNRIMSAHPNDRILVHTVTFKMAEYLYDHLDKTRLLTYTSSSDREYILNRYKSSPNSVLLAPSMDRGIDLPDDLCRVVVVTKIPYPDLGDKQIQARLYEPGNRQNGQVWYATNTIRTLIQMLGRGMRHEHDYCTHYILDDSIYKLSKQWGHLIPKWVKDAFVWGGVWKTDIMEAVQLAPVEEVV